MDEADYTASEKAYRKMMTFDSDFLVGLSLLGRITRNLDERIEIEKKLDTEKEKIAGDERLLLDNYIELVRLTNLRETNPDAVKPQLVKAFQVSEQNLRRIVHRYPDEIYYKAEYIEVLHRNYGPVVALDSLAILGRVDQLQRPFLVGYAANMEAEAGDYRAALKKAKTLEKKFRGTQSPKPYVVYGDIYFKMGNFEEAKKYISKALSLDPGNIDAQRLDKKLSNGN